MNSDISENTFARLINIAGRQRMLSQRIGFLVVTLNRKCEGGEALPSDQLAMLKTAVSDFTHGYSILREGDASQDLPALNSRRVAEVLSSQAEQLEAEAAGAAETGRAIIDRFLTQAVDTVASLEANAPRSEAEINEYSAFVLGAVLQTLQSIVAALEADFDDEMQARKDRRSADVESVMAAISEIQKASKFSRMVALNAKISANRAGPHGREFGALTEEIKKISNNITESSQDIMRHLDHV
ncbi:type IV pili methyl-accepting chemotaxis transducer N-terminal domain-containing protein [Roseibium sp.]|uniref:type IV pili methyl-accepting chemotaxis transducer N-terminal domain-containing protein n=1 Tax=Roseibium sp. TaxID=1936156 RepID=UPI003A97D656